MTSLNKPNVGLNWVVHFLKVPDAVYQQRVQHQLQDRGQRLSEDVISAKETDN